MAPLRISGDTVQLRILLDASSLEVFGQNGESVITDLIFPTPGPRRLGLRSEGDGPRIVSVTLRTLDR